MISIETDNVMRDFATLSLTTRQRASLLCKPEDAVVSYPEFDPFRAVQPIAIVTFPLYVNHKYFELAVFVYENEEEFNDKF